MICILKINIKGEHNLKFLLKNCGLPSEVNGNEKLRHITGLYTLRR
jgi:hypothetical protein